MSSSRSLVCLFALIAGVMVLGRPQGPPDGQFHYGTTNQKDTEFSQEEIHPKGPGMPAELEAILPAETVTQLKAVHADPSLGFQQKQEQIDKIMVQLPVEVLDKIPTPPGFNGLPQEVQQRIKSINRNKDKSWAQKQQELGQYVQSLPADQKALLMAPMQG